MAINYLRRAQMRRPYNEPSDWERGMSIGGQVGKMLGGLGTAIQGAQKNAVANQIMNQGRNILNTTADPDPDPGADLSNLPAPPPMHTGGVDELTMRRQMAKEDLQNQLDQARLAQITAQTEGTGGYAKRATGVTRGLSTGGGKTGVWGGGQTSQYGGDQTDEEAPPLGEGFDPDPKRRQERVDQLLGVKGANLAGATKNADGTYTIKDAKGNDAIVQEDDFNTAWEQQQAGRLHDKLPLRPKPGQAADPTFGTNANPEVLNTEDPTDLQRRSRPPGHIWRTPSGKLIQN